MCSAASAVRWISVDRQFGVVAQGHIVWLLGRTPNSSVLADASRHPSAAGKGGEGCECPKQPGRNRAPAAHGFVMSR